MPYKITNQQNKYQVVDDSGKILGEHETRAKALAQMRALYVHVPDAKSGRRNSIMDVNRLRKIQELVGELLSSESMEEENSSMEDQMDQLDQLDQLDEYLSELPAKSLDLSYIKSIGAPDIDIAVKSIGADEIRGYAVLWGNPKITDVEAEYFTPETNFWDSHLKSAGYKMPLTWDHGQDAAMNADVRIGTITETGDDEIGRWYIARLDRAHRYRKAVDKLISAGKLGTSSDSAPQYVERVKTGKATWLKTWPLFAAALTTTPAEPRMIGNINFLKSLGIGDILDNRTDWDIMQARLRRLKI